MTRDSQDRNRWLRQTHFAGFLWLLVGSLLIGMATGQRSKWNTFTGITAGLIVILLGFGIRQRRTWARPMVHFASGLGVAACAISLATAIIEECQSWSAQISDVPAIMSSRSTSATAVQFRSSMALQSLLLVALTWQMHWSASHGWRTLFRASPSRREPWRFRVSSLLLGTMLIAVALAGNVWTQHGSTRVQAGAYSFVSGDRVCEVAYAIVAPRARPKQELLQYAIFHFVDSESAFHNRVNQSVGSVPYRWDSQQNWRQRENRPESFVRFGDRQLNVQQLGTLLELDHDTLQQVLVEPGITKDEFQSYLASFPEPPGANSLVEFVRRLRQELSLLPK